MAESSFISFSNQWESLLYHPQAYTWPGSLSELKGMPVSQSFSSSRIMSSPSEESPSQGSHAPGSHLPWTALTLVPGSLHPCVLVIPHPTIHRFSSCFWIFLDTVFTLVEHYTPIIPSPYPTLLESAPILSPFTTPLPLSCSTQINGQATQQFVHFPFSILLPPTQFHMEYLTISWAFSGHPCTCTLV